MAKDKNSVQAQLEEIGYNPADGFFDKSEKEQLSMIRAKRIEYAKRDAVAVLGTFMTDDIFATCPENVQEAIKTLAVKRTGGGGGGVRKNVFMDTLKGFLSSIGDSVDELEMFKATKMGRGEIRAKIRENLKNADAADRFWVELDADSEEWTLIGIGADQPEGWAGAAIE